MKVWEERRLAEMVAARDLRWERRALAAEELARRAVGVAADLERLIPEVGRVCDAFARWRSDDAGRAADAAAVDRTLERAERRAAIPEGPISPQPGENPLTCGAHATCPHPDDAFAREYLPSDRAARWHCRCGRVWTWRLGCWS